jgi:hypothetical protein
MNNNIIVELRQKEAQMVSRNGEYDVLLKKQVVLEEGDTVALKSVMIDTIAQSSGQITIPDDLTLKINYGVYINNWTKNDTSAEPEYSPYIEYGLNGANLGTVYGDGKLCIPYKKIPGVESGYATAQGFQYYANSNNREGGGNVDVVYSYINSSGQTSYIHSRIPYVEYGQYYSDNFGSILFLIGSFQLITNILDYNLSPEGLEDVVPIESTKDHYIPYNFEILFQLPKGVYTADQLSLYLSEMFSSNPISPYNNGTAGNFIKNGFLKNTKLFAEGQPEPDGQNANVPANVLFVKYNNGFLSAIDFNLEEGGVEPINFLIGASQIDINYNELNNSFEINYIHTPLLDQATGKNLSIKYLLGANNNVSAVGAHSGIYFTNLQAFDSQNKPYDFFKGVLGFDVPSMVVGFDGVVSNFFGNNNSLWVVLNQPLLGQNITSNYIGLDTAVQKTTNWFMYKTLELNDTDYILDSTADPNTTNAIIAPNKQAEQQNKFSHYLIDLNMKFQNEFIGAEDVYRTYNGIVNKYYASGSYLYGDESASIIYEHRGQPLVLRSVKCRILTSDKTPDPLIGADNTIYMQVIKAQPKN